jgi:prepilin-type N-terminal cleavage/methylation domain-containing protein
MNSDPTRGFTIIEILLVISILAVITSIITISLAELNGSQSLEKSADLVVAVLGEARSSTLSSKDDMSYGVHLTPSQMILFRGDTYLDTDPNNVVTDLNTLTGIKDVVLVGGGRDITFKRLTGGTDEVGTFKVFLQASTDTFKTITVSATGVVSVI